MASTVSSITVSELSQHNKPDDIWIVVDGNVYDMTKFAPEHPGGADIIYKYAGRDATKEYSEVHPPSLIATELPPSAHVGRCDTSELPTDLKSPAESKSVVTSEVKPPLSAILNLNDFEEAGSRGLTPKAWAFISGASNDNLTRDANKNWFQKIWFNPRILINVASVNTRSRVLGCDVSIPVFISPAGLAKTAGPEGELALARGAAETGIVQCISTTASYPLSEIIGAAPKSYPFFFQLYVNKDRRKTEALLRDVTAHGVKAIMVTVDLPVVSKREADERVQQQTVEISAVSGAKTGTDKKGAGLGRTAGSYIDPTLSWDDLAWIRKHTHLPILLKGVQSAADARKAMQMGCKGIVVSNHGGRALDNGPPAILTLLELHKECPEVFSAMEILIDGGIRRGSDILKAVCLGATAVGLGRPFMYALSYGTPGVVHAVNILKDELETAMRLCGITDLSEASPDHVNTAELDWLLPRAHHPYARKVLKAKPKL